MSKIIDNKILKSLRTLISASIIAQISTVISAPILTRIYSAEDIGIFMYVLAIIQTFSAVICGRYDVLIVSEKKKDSLPILIGISSVITLLLSFIISFSIYFLPLLDELNLKRNFVILMIFFALIFSGAINILNSYNNRLEMYDVISKFLIKRTVFQNIFSVFFGLMGLSYLGLIFSYVFGQLIGIKAQSKLLLNNFTGKLTTSKEEVINLIIVNKSQPIFSAPSIIVNSLSYSIIVFLLEILYGLGIVGFYSMTIRILGLPLSIISGNIARVFYQEASKEYHNQGSFLTTFIKILRIQIVIAIPMLLIMLIFAPYFFELFFGEEWAITGLFVQILAPMFAVRFVVSTFSQALILVKKQKHELLIQILFVISSISVFLLSHLYDLSIEIFLALISISYTVVYLIFFNLIYQSAKK